MITRPQRCAARKSTGRGMGKGPRGGGEGGDRARDLLLERVAGERVGRYPMPSDCSAVRPARARESATAPASPMRFPLRTFAARQETNRQSFLFQFNASLSFLYYPHCPSLSIACSFKGEMRGDERKARDLRRAQVGEGGGGARKEEEEGAWSKSKSERGPSRGWGQTVFQSRERERQEQERLSERDKQE